MRITVRGKDFEEVQRLILGTMCPPWRSIGGSPTGPPGLSPDFGPLPHNPIDLMSAPNKAAPVTRLTGSRVAPLDIIVAP